MLLLGLSGKLERRDPRTGVEELLSNISVNITLCGENKTLSEDEKAKL